MKDRKSHKKEKERRRAIKNKNKKKTLKVKMKLEKNGNKFEMKGEGKKKKSQRKEEKLEYPMRRTPSLQLVVQWLKNKMKKRGKKEKLGKNLYSL